MNNVVWWIYCDSIFLARFEIFQASSIFLFILAYISYAFIINLFKNY